MLWPLELFYKAVARYQRQRLTSHAPGVDVKVVIVGNISVGGTGKTPTMIALVRQLTERGLRVGVVSRGYGRDTKGVISVSSDHTASQVGDEPLLIKLNTNVPVVVGEDRVAAVRKLTSLYHPDIVLSDDGLQHYRLRRDFEIVVIDSARGTGNGHCLPLGPLRESAQRLKEVDAIVVNGSGELIDRGATSHQLCLNPQLPRQIFNDQILSAGQSVHAVAGIGNPQRFFDTLRQLGFDVESHAFADHHLFTSDDFVGMSDKPIVMTSKDAVKCAKFNDFDLYEVTLQPEVSKSLIDQIVNVVQNDRH